MKIKLALLEKDRNYLNRIVSVFNTKYSDKFEIYSFSDLDMALETIENIKIDVFVVDEVFDIDLSKLPKRCGMAYFVDSADIDTFKEKRAICKFQKIDLIYKQIISVYSENAGSISEFKLENGNCNVICFSSPCGGCGNSTMAVATAVHFASQGKKTLYLNLEKFGSSDVFFKADGQFDMSDIIFALKSKNTNLSLKLESSVKLDNRGVYFYSQSKIALDMLELNMADIIRLISEIKLSSLYEYVVVDLDFSITTEYIKLYKQMNSIVMVSDGSETANSKLLRAYNAILTLEMNEDTNLINKINLIYNKFSNKTSKAIEDTEIKTLGGAPRYEHALCDQIVAQLATMSIFDKLSQQ